MTESAAGRWASGLARLLMPALMLPLLLSLTACGAPAPAAEELWASAMADAVFSEESEVMELVALTPEDPEVIWDEAGERALLLTWHGADAQYEPGEPMAQAGEIWATSAGEMIKWYRANGRGVDDWTLRFAQLLGIPGDTDYDRFTAFWVRPEDVIRPAYVTDPTEQMENGYDLVPEGDYKDWFDSNILWSYFESEYPWTRLGYTYDWSGGASEYGLTEFLLLDGTAAQAEFTLSTPDFVGWLEEQVN